MTWLNPGMSHEKPLIYAADPRRKPPDLRRCRSRAAPPGSAVLDGDAGGPSSTAAGPGRPSGARTVGRSGRGAIDAVEEIDVPVDLDAAADVPAGSNQIEAGDGGADVGPQQRQVAARPPRPGRVVAEGQLQLSAGGLAVEGAQAVGGGVGQAAVVGAPDAQRVGGRAQQQSAHRQAQIGGGGGGGGPVAGRGGGGAAGGPGGGGGAPGGGG